MSELASPGQLRASFMRWALVCVPGVMLLGLLSGRIAGSGPGNPWFEALVKPAIYPPSALFGIVWSVLYLLMGVSLAVVASARGAPGRGLALAIFAFQLLLNLAWSPLFFGAHQITGALILIAVLDIAVIATVMLFWRIRPLAGMLLLPYLGWILFATLLTYEFRAANPGADGQEGAGATQRFEL
jgi:translocator protein